MTSKLRVDLPLLLPDVAHDADACVQRLLDELKVQAGVQDVHVDGASRSAGRVLCVHYDPATLPLARIRNLVESAGARITERFGHVLWNIKGIGHQRQARRLSAQLLELPGVLEAEATVGGAVRIEFDRAQTTPDSLRSALAAAGWGPEFEAAPDEADGDEHRVGDEVGHHHGGIFGANGELIFSLVCGGLVAMGFAIEKLAPFAGWLPLAFYLGAYLFGGFYTVGEALQNLKLKRFEIDALMLVAAAGAAALGAWAEGALLLFLFSLGHSLENYAMGRAKRAIESLAELAPATSQVRRGDTLVEIAVEGLLLGDVVVVLPNERLPADGFVVAGESAVNQAPITGESAPVDKRPVPDRVEATARPDLLDAAHRVFAGSINGSGAIDIVVTKRSSESALARIVKMVSEAQTRQSPTQRFTDKFERYFVPSVLGVAVLLLFAWVIVDEPFRDSFYRAMAVLVAASPCALAIATPSAVLSGIARAARGGVLIKGGAPLERLGALEALAFDKTGTLTEGRPHITDVAPAPDVDEVQLLATAVAVEALSDHPLARAILRDGAQRLGAAPVPTATGLRSLIGQGVVARIDDDTVQIGKAEMFGTDDLPPLSGYVAATVDRLRNEGRTTMVVRRDGRDLGVIGLMDTPRASARAALDRLRAIGITRMVMLSGDNQRVADAVARQVGLSEAWGDLMPEDKVAAIVKLRDAGEVAMVGDGVNDAPAMANATVGIAMGAAGSDVALETADVALMADDLTQLPFAVALSRRARNIIRQNVVVSLAVVALLVPATILGLGIGPAVAAHEGSTLVVVFNALRLLAYREP
jgi:Cd2+/Zn2+-exporting ATPase